MKYVKLYDAKRLCKKKSKWLMHKGIPEIVVVLNKRREFFDC
jgi:hypothetical protein